jgi:hypothetical protein
MERKIRQMWKNLREKAVLLQDFYIYDIKGDKIGLYSQYKLEFTGMK